MRNFLMRSGLVGLCFGMAVPAAGARSDDNTNYGETRFSKLPLGGMVSKNVWVGSWWAYRTDGLAYRLHDSSVSRHGYKTDWSRWDSQETADLSPAEKFDKLMGRSDDIEYEMLVSRGQKVQEISADMQSMIDERKALIRTLNKAIRDAVEPGFDWADTEDGKRYLALKKEIETAEQDVKALSVTVDTATEYEVLNHGTLQFGVESWFGHCNAWAGAAVLEPEPRRSTVVDGIEFTAGDVKAYLTENLMEMSSGFFGSRNNDHQDEENREDVSYQDVTPAAFHILFADMIGNRDMSFVIDRFTGSEVWNQPVKAYRSSVEPLYEDDKPVEREVKLTQYGYRNNEVIERGEQMVYPILVTTTMHWITDGLPHETLTVQNITNDIDDETFKSSHRIEDLYGGQVELRTLTYELWLDKPLSDDSARIIGDGAWDHGSISGYEHAHPDFIWTPKADANNRSRDYENEFVDAKVVQERLLPGTLAPADDPAVEATTFVAAGSVAIPDQDTEVGATLSVQVTGQTPIAVMTVSVDIAHTYIGDLELRIAGPSGRSVVLKPFGDGGAADDIEETYDVKAFNGDAAAGTWVLTVKDQWAQDVGEIKSLSVSFK